jgi:LmbE family N-acetylglucosaminyl deacetylase
MSNIVLVIAAHSDDEALGFAGIMAKLIAAGDQVHVISMKDGVGSRKSVANEANDRLSSAEKSAKTLGVASM